MSHSSEAPQPRVLALDLGDRKSVLAHREGKEVVFEEIRTTRDAVHARFEGEPPSRVVLEAGSQSHWIAWMLAELGHEPLVAQPRRLRMITQSSCKTDRADAEWLLLLGEVDLDILSPVRLRGRQRQLDLALLRSREKLMRMRAQGVQHVRGLAKIFGCALQPGGVVAFPRRARAGLDPELRPIVEPMLGHIEALTESLRCIEKRLEALADSDYPETALLRQVYGIGPLTALAVVLTLQDCRRFRRARDAGAAVGLVPRKRESGASAPELRITKSGDVELRRLLVLAAHRLVRTSAPDSDLKRFGQRLAARGGKSAKKRALVAVARKLTVLLVALWRSGEVYDPLRQARLAGELPTAEQPDAELTAAA